MSKATELLQKGVFFVATADGDQPQVRPFGATAEIDGKTYICLNNKKKVFDQLQKNPKLAIAGVIEGMKWYRITAKANRDDTNESRAKFLEASPNLKNMYKADDGIYEVFYLTDINIEEF